MYLDARILRKALAEADGPVSLGELRRTREWQPQPLLKLVTEHIDQFTMTQVIESGRLHPAIEAQSELNAEAKSFVKAVREGGKNGVTAAKLWKLYKIKTETSVHLAGEFPDLVSTRRKGLKTYFFWKPKLESAKPAVSEPAETATEASSKPPDAFLEPGNGDIAVQGSNALPEAMGNNPELEAAKDRLLELVKDGTRSSSWLSEFGYDMGLLVSVVNTWPELFKASVVNLSNSEHGAFLNVSLRKGEEVPAASQPVEPTVSLQPPLAELVPAEQLAELRFKPACRHMQTRRNNPQLTRGGLAHHRNPLVELK
jgi:hypothetical protein